MSTNMYIKFEEPAIGGAAAGDHAGEIEVLSWNHGFAQPTRPTRGSAGGGTVEQATHQNLTFTKYLDAGTNELLKYCWSGKQFGKVTLECYRNTGGTDTPLKLYLRISMQHVIISNYSVSGGPGDIPVENISLDYGIVKYEYLASHEQPNAAESAVAPVVHDLTNRVVE